MVKISYICPIYNKVKYLKKVLASIKNQQGEFSKEFIFINDGSTDGSLELLKNQTLNWKNILIINQINQGPAIATQNGIKRAKGEYIKLVGGDDIMAPHCSELLLKTILKKNSVAAFSAYKLLDNYSEIIFDKKDIKNFRVLKNPLFQTVKSSFSGTTPNLYCNKSIKKSGGCNNKIFVEDFSLVLGLSNFGSFSFIDNVTSYGPSNDANRIMIGQKVQLIHDYNAALFYFFKSNTEICNEILKVACVKSLGRSDKLFRREIGGSSINLMKFYKLSLLFGRKDYINLIRKSCEFIYEKTDERSVRYKINHSP